MSRLTAAFRQIAALIREHGPGRALAVIFERVKNKFVDTGDVVWLAKPAMTPETLRADQAPYEMREVQTSDEHAELDRLRPLAPDVRKLREAAGGRRWAAYERETGDLAFTCWTYTKSLIVSERPAVTLSLPADTWQLEDSYVPRAKRGTPGSVAAVEALGIRYLEEQGRPLRLVTKVDVENIAALKSAEHHGNWRRIAVAHGRKVIGRPTRWRIDSLDTEADDDLVSSLKSLERGA